MPFVPVMHRPEEPSLQAIELSQRLQQTIAEYQQRNPGLSAEDIRQAASLAARQAGGDSAARPPVAALLAAGAAAVVLGVGLFAQRDPAGAGPWMVPLAIIAAVAAVMIAVTRLRRR